MGVTLLSRRLVRLAVAGALAMFAVVPTAAPTLAADPVLSRPTVTARFLSHIAFTGTATLSSPVRRLEIVLDIEGETRSIVVDLGLSQTSGRTELEYILETPGGGILPNTDVTGRFRATLDDGTMIDGPSTTVHYEDTRFDWRTLSGNLVTVHWTEGGAAFGRRALRIAEDAVGKVGDLLGVAETDPIDFYVYSDRTAFYDILGPGSRENIGGLALPEIRTLFANIKPDRIEDPWVGVVLPHELTHLGFDTAIRNPYHDPPHWLDEGVAVYLSEGYGLSDRSAVADAVARGSLMPLRALAGQPPTRAEQFYLAYAEYASAVDFLVRQYGADSMVSLVRSYANGVTDDEAFLAALGTDVAGFEEAWLDDLGAPVPSPYGPVDAPPGPVPADWLGDGAVPGEIPESAASPAPTAGVEPETSSPEDGQATGLLAGLVVVGLALASAGVWLARRNRVIASRIEPAIPEPPAMSMPAADDGGPADDGGVPAADGPASDEAGLDERLP